MSTDAGEGEENKACCASCGIAEGDDVKLKRCNGCYLVRYCGIECQKEHRPKHKEECKKRASELRDEILFKQPECSDIGDCPICCFPLPIDEKISLQRCCSKRICCGCLYAHMKREVEEELENKCPFCRSPQSYGLAESQTLKRVEANDPVALCDMGKEHAKEGDFQSALEYFTKAVKFGDKAEAHFLLSQMYHYGDGVEKDKKKELYHLEEAAIGGYPEARHNLGAFEGRNKKYERATKHWIIAASMGYDESLEYLKKNYATGFVTKEEFASALRAHQAAVDATKSPQREEARMFMHSLKKK